MIVITESFSSLSHIATPLKKTFFGNPYLFLPSSYERSGLASSTLLTRDHTINSVFSRRIDFSLISLYEVLPYFPSGFSLSPFSCCDQYGQYYWTTIWSFQELLWLPQPLLHHLRHDQGCLHHLPDVFIVCHVPRRLSMLT